MFSNKHKQTQTHKAYNGDIFAFMSDPTVKAFVLPVTTEIDKSTGELVVVDPTTVRFAKLIPDLLTVAAKLFSTGKPQVHSIKFSELEQTVVLFPNRRSSDFSEEIDTELITRSFKQLNTLVALLDLKGKEAVVMPRIGDEYSFKLWPIIYDEIAQHYLDRRYIVVNSIDLSIYRESVRKSFKKPDEHPLYSLDSGLKEAYELYQELDISSHESLIKGLCEIRDSQPNNMKLVQRVIEFTFSRKGIRRFILQDLNNYPNVLSLIDIAVEYIKDWANKLEYPSKTLDKIKLLNPYFDLRAMVFDLLSVICHKSYVQNCVPLTAVCGDAVKYTPFGVVIPEIGEIDPSKPDTPLLAHKRAIKLTGCLYGLLGKLGLVNFISAQESPSETLAIRVPEYLSEHTITAIEISEILPPMVSLPMEIKHNGNSGYLTQDTARITNRYFAHNENICLDVINMLNKTPFKINERILLEVEPVYKLPKKHLSMSKKALILDKNNWHKQLAITYRIAAMLLALGNKFWFEWFICYRGREYSRGYHLNIQGDDFRKAMLDFSEPTVFDYSKYKKYLH